MAFRGRGRGRFGGGGGAFYAKQEPYILFPEIELPARRTVTNEEKPLIIMRSNLQKYWRASPYYLEETGPSVIGQNSDIERYCDRGKPKIKHTRGSFMQFLEADTSNFPKELVADTRDQRKRQKKVQWNLDSGLQKLDMFEKLEQKYEGQEGKGEGEKKEGEEEDKDDDEELGEEEEDQSDGDYEQNVDFDDDEDDYNLAEDNDDEGVY